MLIKMDFATQGSGWNEMTQLVVCDYLTDHQYVMI